MPEYINELIVSHGLRPTAARLMVARALSESSGPMSVADLELKLETVDKSVIFRTLCAFRDAHLVHTIEGGSEGVCYELCKSKMHGHDEDVHVHFHCLKCGRTFCFEDIPVPGVRLPEGYTAETSTYIVKGLCPCCAASE